MRGYDYLDKNKDFLLLQECERRRIAEDLHDTTVQELVYLLQQLELSLIYFDKDPAQAKLELISARKNIRKIIDGIRDTIYNLRPMSFDDLGWNSSINKLYDELNDFNINVYFDIDDLDTSDGVTAITIYRIINELTKNVIKHSKANNLWVNVIKADNEICVIVKDDGIGIIDFNKENHFGLQFVQERINLLSGNFSMTTNNKGTEFTISIPI